jgi:Arc/MetJ-type ribon-helix-helix transcriptional regulator
MVAIPFDSAHSQQSVPPPTFAEAIGLARRLAALRRTHRPYEYEVSLRDLLRVDLGSDTAIDAAQPMGRARKVSVSLPEELIMALQQRLDKGEFSQYVTEAVARQFELDLVAELAAIYEAEDGPVPEELVKEAMAEWPDAR